MRFPLHRCCVIESNENINLSFFPIIGGWPSDWWCGGGSAARCTFSTCAHNLRGAVLGNIFHLLWCRARRRVPLVVLIYQTCMFTLYLGSQVLQWQLCLSGIRMAISKAAQNSASVFNTIMIVRPETGILFNPWRTASSKDSPTWEKAAGWDCLVFSRNEGKPQTFAFLSKQINARHSLASPVCSIPGIWDGCIALFPSLQCVTNIYSKIIDNANKKHLERHPATYPLLLPFL